MSQGLLSHYYSEINADIHVGPAVKTHWISIDCSELINECKRQSFNLHASLPSMLRRVICLKDVNWLCTIFVYKPWTSSTLCHARVIIKLCKVCQPVWVNEHGTFVSVTSGLESWRRILAVQAVQWNILKDVQSATSYAAACRSIQT